MTPDSMRDGADPLDGIQIIDCDAHLTEPADLWSSRVTSAWSDRIPTMRTIDGQTAWYMHGEPWARTGGNTIDATGQKVLGTHSVQPFDKVATSSWVVKDRLELLDSLGVHSQILYPNGIGFASNHIFAIEDRDEREVILRIYNDFLVDVQFESGDRLLPQAMLPIWDMDFTIKEMTRLIDAGIRGFTISDKPELLGLPELPEPYFEPMWDLFNESGAVVNFHIASGARREEIEANRISFAAAQNPDSPAEHEPEESADVPATPSPTWRSFGPQRRMALLAAQSEMSNIRIISNLCMSNLFDRYPQIQIVSAESGIGWVPFLLESLEYQFDQMVTNEKEAKFAQRRPREYFNDHLFVMFWFETVGPQRLMDAIGIDRILIETDIPHPTCLYPDTRHHLARSLEGVDHESRLRVLQQNAAELYRIDVR